MSVFSLFFAPETDDVLLFGVMLVTLVFTAYLGQTTSSARATHGSGDSVLVSGAILSLSGLLIGFMFSLAISGYVAREQALAREARAIGIVWQYASLQSQKEREKTETQLREYIDDRIHFFTEKSAQKKRVSVQLAREKQAKLWQGIVQSAGRNPTPVMASVLASYSALYTSLQETQADWRRQIPDAAWIVLALFAACASFLSGYQYRGKRKRHVFIILLPVLMTLVLFMIAEIDLPGEGIIRVTPDDLQQLALSLFKIPGGIHDPTLSVYPLS